VRLNLVKFYLIIYVQITLIKQLIWKEHVKASKRTTLYDSCWTKKLNCAYIWVDISQVNITCENRKYRLKWILIENTR